ncbi:YqeB family protein [Georgenia subflava]|uniref:Uncharacterized protein n=1 Tax=Georgenia subflava TaxID=1622177 RepID=A0A6N7EME1_9MICO|nr:hypothetical protein [Georgenia subflava]MPV38298.1 hypothetical protein [Georgenia subflava]
MASSTTIRLPLRVRIALCTGHPLAGAVLGVGVALLVEWLAETSVTFDGVMGAGDRVGEPVALTVLGGLGLLVGLVLAVSVLGESLRAQVSDRAITLEWDDARVSVPRPLIRSVVLDGDLVLLGPGGVELARVRCDVDRGELRRALAAHGYPEPVSTDPHADAFVPVCPAGGLTEQDLRLLSARARAVAAGEHGDAELLRRQLAARGIMVRDVHRPGRRSAGQQWRAVESMLAPHAAAA